MFNKPINCPHILILCLLIRFVSVYEVLDIGEPRLFLLKMSNQTQERLIYNLVSMTTLTKLFPRHCDLTGYIQTRDNLKSAITLSGSVFFLLFPQISSFYFSLSSTCLQTTDQRYSRGIKLWPAPRQRGKSDPQIWP